MKTPMAAAGMALVLAASAQAEPVPRIEEADAYVAVPGGALPAERTGTYRAVFDATAGAAKPSEMIPAVRMAADELNTLNAHGVDRSRVSFAVVLHSTAADEAALSHAAYRAKYGIDNPNLPILARLKAAGVPTYVCGQQLAADGVSLSAIAPEATVADDGLIAIMTFQARGYAHLSF